MTMKPFSFDLSILCHYKIVNSEVLYCCFRIEKPKQELFFFWLLSFVDNRLLDFCFPLCISEQTN